MPAFMTSPPGETARRLFARGPGPRQQPPIVPVARPCLKRAAGLALPMRSLLAVSAVALCHLGLAAAAQAQAPARDHRYEVTLVFGASLLSADGDGQQALPFDSLQSFEALLPAGTLRRLLPSSIETHDHMGASFLQGFQISRRLARRGWIEGEFLIAPAHTRRRTASFR